MKPFYFYFLLFSSLGAFAQAPLIEWQDTFGGTDRDEYRSMVITADGGVVIAGASQSVNGDLLMNHGGNDVLLVKYDASGGIVWKKTFGGSSYDEARSIRQTSDNGFVICGFSNSNDGDAAVTHNYDDYWIVKTDAAGNLEWQKSYGGNSTDIANDIRQTTDGGYIVIGQSQSNTFNGDMANHYAGDDVWILKLDAMGNKQWEKNYGGSGEDTGRSIFQTADGDFIFAASTNSFNHDVVGVHDPYNYTGSYVNRDMWIVKINAVGTLLWQTCVGGNGGDALLGAHSMAQTADGGVIIAGENYGPWAPSSFAYYNCKLAKLSANGVIEWEKVYGGTYDDRAYCVVQTSDGGYVFAAQAQSGVPEVVGIHGGSGPHGYYGDIWLVKTDALGNVQWKKCYGGDNSETPYALAQTADDGFLIAGTAASNNSGDVVGTAGIYDAWLLKLSAATLGTQTETALPGFTIYPNPTRNSMSVSSPALIASYNVVDNLGRIVKQGTTTPIDVTNLQPGVYVLRVHAENGQIESQKFIKQ
jgi:Secretion system C-terminal sorting domain